MVVDCLISGTTIPDSRDSEDCPQYWKSIFGCYIVQVGHPLIDSGSHRGEGNPGEIDDEVLPIEWQVPIRRNQRVLTGH